jgi:hypothetical protein
MRLLIAVANLQQIKPFLENLEAQGVELPESLQNSNAGAKYIHTFKALQHEIDVLEAGVGVYQVSYKTTKALTAQRYHLALQVSTGNAYKAVYSPGTVLNVINEKPGDYGMWVDGEWKDQYDFNLINRDDAPHVRGGLVNMNNSYVNVLMPFKKVVGVTVNDYGNKDTYKVRLEKYKADVETGDGVGFVYPCLFEKQNFYRLVVVERNLETGEENYDLALKALNDMLIEVVQKL